MIWERFVKQNKELRFRFKWRYLINLKKNINREKYNNKILKHITSIHNLKPACACNIYLLNNIYFQSVYFKVSNH